jgi:hypothetical protein
MNQTPLDEYAPRCGGMRCEIKDDCPLYLDRDNANARRYAKTLRLQWESLQIHCVARQQYFGEVSLA